uniref:Uncharacterized protein n=1 Tax=Romanomermis culicivorax TaxID=13658 RepID=A0A915KJJ0_ROMCU
MFLKEKPADSTKSSNKPTNPNFDVSKFKQQIAYMVQKSTLTPKQQCKLEKFLISNPAVFSLEEPSDQPALVHDQDLIVDPANLPDQNTGWPFTQEQDIEGQKNDPTLETTCQKIEKESGPFIVTLINKQDKNVITIADVFAYLDECTHSFLNIIYT